MAISLRSSTRSMTLPCDRLRDPDAIAEVGTLDAPMCAEILVLVGRVPLTRPKKNIGRQIRSQRTTAKFLPRTDCPDFTSCF